MGCFRSAGVNMGDVKLVILDGDRMIYCIWFDCTAYTGKHNWIYIFIYIYIYIYNRPICQQCALAYHPLMEFLLDNSENKMILGFSEWFSMIFDGILYDVLWYSVMFCRSLKAFDYNNILSILSLSRTILKTVNHQMAWPLLRQKYDL